MLRLILATRNPHKTREFAQILGPRYAVTDLTNVPDVQEVDETGSTFEENAILKAVATSQMVPGLVVADDSGLEVAWLRGAPGIFSARYAGTGAPDGENISKLLTALAEAEERSAQFFCAIAAARDGQMLKIFHGIITGRVTSAPRGEGGFGYDPIFVPKGFEQTFAQLGETVKNRISHRARAIGELRHWLTEFGAGKTERTKLN